MEVVYTLPDYGDAPELYQCSVSGDLFRIAPEAEEYIGPAWDQRRKTEHCPTCSESLEFACSYPDNFCCPECRAIGRYEPDTTTYPDENRSVMVGCWDPYPAEPA